jgi:hypothetical protein
VAGWAQKQSGTCEEKKNLDAAGNQTPADQSVTILTELFRLV